MKSDDELRYLSAVKGRRDFRQALKEARGQIKVLEKVIEQLQRGIKAERANPLSDPRVRALWEAAKHYAGWLSDNGYENNALERSLAAFETKELE